MSEALSAIHTPIDAGLGGVLLANMIEAWLAGNPDRLESVEAADESQDHGAAPEQTRLHLCTPVDQCPGAPPSGEHRAPVRPASDGAGTGLERIIDPDARPGPGYDRDRDDQARGLQDAGGGCLDGPSGRGVCAGGFAAGAIESRLASAAGVVCLHRDAG